MRLMKGDALFMNNYLTIDVLLSDATIREWTFYKGRESGSYIDYITPSFAKASLEIYKEFGGFPRCAPHYFPRHFGKGKVYWHRRRKYRHASDEKERRPIR